MNTINEIVGTNTKNNNGESELYLCSMQLLGIPAASHKTIVLGWNVHALLQLTENEY